MLKKITGGLRQTIFWTVVGAIVLPVALIVKDGGDIRGALLYGIPAGAFSGLVLSFPKEKLMRRSRSLPADESDDESEE